MLYLSFRHSVNPCCKGYHNLQQPPQQFAEKFSLDPFFATLSVAFARGDATQTRWAMATRLSFQWKCFSDVEHLRDISPQLSYPCPNCTCATAPCMSNNPFPLLLNPPNNKNDGPSPILENFRLANLTFNWSPLENNLKIKIDKATICGFRPLIIKTS